MPAIVSRGFSSRWTSDERVEQPGEALEREVLGLDGDDHAIGGDSALTVSGPSDGGQSSSVNA